jgi:peptidoglycan/xylan/chitin deacetylase (PgdA/CDA1 family)
LNLGLGITKELTHWNIILKQVGVAYSKVDWGKNLLEKYPVIIVSSDLNKEETKKILQFVNHGGSLLTESDFAKKLFKANTKQVNIRYLFSGKKVFGYYLPIIDLFRNCGVPVNANMINNQDGQFVVSSFKHEGGNVIIIPGNFVSAILECSILRKKMPSSFKQSPTERVSKVSKGSINHFIRAILEHLYHIRDLPFVTLWNFPGDTQNIFLFRIDTDYCTLKQVDVLYKTLRKNEIKGTWFVETKSVENWIDKYSSFENQEIGLHCYRHRIFRSYKKNYDNFKHGLQILEKAGISAKGIASPFGEWNKSYGKAISDLGLIYSSEFSYSYDNFPHFPASKDSMSGVLQVPVHPISFGRLYRERYTNNEMLSYFLEVIEKKISLNEPVILYTHPTEERLDILQEIFNKINQLNLPSITFSQFAEWWKDRNDIIWQAYFQDGEVQISTDSKDKSFWFYVKNHDGKNYISPLLENSYEKQSKVALDFNYTKETDPSSLRKFDWQMFKDDILFHIRKHKY